MQCISITNYFFEVNYIMFQIVLLTFCLTSFSQNYMVSTYYFETFREYTISDVDIFIFTTMYTINDSLDLTCSPKHSRFTLYLLPFKPFFANNKRCKVFVRHKRTIYTSHLLSNIIAIFVELLLKLSGDVESNPGPTRYEEFYEKLNSIIDSKDSTSQIFSRNEISAKINSCAV